MLVGRAGGVAVVLAPEGAVAGVDTRGAPVGTRELDLLDPSTLVQRVHAVVLGEDLAAADGVMRWLGERGHGFPVDGGVVPIVPAAAVTPEPPAAVRPLDSGVEHGGPTGLVSSDPGYAACEAAAEVGVPEAIVLVGETAAAVVVVDAALTKAECRRIAMSAHDGLVRAGVRVPATVFAVATGTDTAVPLDDLCTAAADAVRAAARPSHV